MYKMLPIKNDRILFCQVLGPFGVLKNREQIKEIKIENSPHVNDFCIVHNEETIAVATSFNLVLLTLTDIDGTNLAIH